MNTLVPVYVPVPGSTIETMIDPGSGIVGTSTSADRTLIDFEGNRYNAWNIQTYEDKIKHAVHRHKVRYPTVARILAPTQDLIEIGNWDIEAEALSVTNQEALDRWLSP